MRYFGKGLSEKHKELNKSIRKQDNIEQAKTLFLDLHSALHVSEISGTYLNEVDGLLGDLHTEEYAVMPTSKDETIAWVLWHTARIEDLTMGILVAGKDQLFDSLWMQKLNVHAADTGNAMTDDEIMELSKNINIKELLRYRNEVGKKTREIVGNLRAEDMKRKTDPSGLAKILSLGGVTEQEESVWLLDFWGKKDVAGLLLMPPTRHVMLHLNDCCRWKEYIRTKNKYYRK